MSRRILWTGVCSCLLLSLVVTTGCFNASLGPQLGLLGVPIPVSPYFQKKFEDNAWETERYKKVVIMGPLVAGGPCKALDAPSDDEILRALEKARPVEGGWPLLHTKMRNDIRIVKKKVLDQVDPPRVYPHIGPAQLHHAHYVCKIYFSEKTVVGWPMPYTYENQDACEVILVDHDHFHRVGNVDPGFSGGM